MKRDTVYKRAANLLLDHVGALPPGAPLESENRLARRLDVSRTTVRKILADLTVRGIVAAADAKYRVLRNDVRDDYFPAAQTVPTADQVEKKFMEWMLRGNRRPGDDINGLELARQFDVSPGAIREYLQRFSHFGLIEKRPNYGWVFRGFTADFALELFQVRELFETTSARAFALQPPEAPAWVRLEGIEREHRALLENIEERYRDFSGLDERLHRLVNDAAKSRFFMGFYDIVSLIFHYHYQWNKVDELQRNRVAIEEHLAYIAALFSRDEARIEATCRAHLASARKTLLASLA